MTAIDEAAETKIGPRARLSLRPYRDDDFDVMKRIRSDRDAQHLLLAHPDAEPLDHDISLWIHRRLYDRDGVFLVIDSGGSAAGFVQISRIHRIDRHGFGGICLEASCRGQGIGLQAMSELFEAATGSGLRKLLLEVRVDNPIALKLYERCGFRSVGVMRDHYHDGHRWHDVVLLERMLDGSP